MFISKKNRTTKFKEVGIMKLFKFLVKLCVFSSLLVFLVFGCTEDCVCPDDDTVKYYGWTVGLDDSSYGVVLHTQDGGETWTRQGDSLLFAGVHIEDICVIDKNNLIVAGTLQQNGVYGVFKSEDGGNTWTLSGNRSLANVDYRGLFSLDENNVWLVGKQGTIYHTADMGDTWTKLEVPVEYQQDIINRIVAKNSDELWVGGQQHVNDDYPIMLHTVDGGLNWERVNPFESMNIVGAGWILGLKTYGNTVWAVGGQGEFVIRSDDNGTTWENITSGSGEGIFDANDIHLLSETAAYVAKDLGQFYSTNNAGMDWVQFHTGSAHWLLCIAFINEGKIWICGQPLSSGTSIIKYSPNGGTTWQDQTPQILLDNDSMLLYKIRFIEVD